MDLFILNVSQERFHSFFVVQLAFTSDQFLAMFNANVTWSFRAMTVKVLSNKEKSDMLWSRVRILDDRLAHVRIHAIDGCYYACITSIDCFLLLVMVAFYLILVRGYLHGCLVV